MSDGLKLLCMSLICRLLDFWLEYHQYIKLWLVILLLCVWLRALLFCSGINLFRTLNCCCHTMFIFCYNMFKGNRVSGLICGREAAIPSMTLIMGANLLKGNIYIYIYILFWFIASYMIRKMLCGSSWANVQLRIGEKLSIRE